MPKRIKYRTYWLTSNYYRNLRKNENKNISENAHTGNIATSDTRVSDQLINSTETIKCRILNSI